MNCPNCKKPLLVWCSLKFGQVAVTCMNPDCPTIELVGTGDTESEAIEDFERKAGKEMGK